MTVVYRSTLTEFQEALAAAGESRPLVASATTEPDDLPTSGTYYLTSDGQSGFGYVDSVDVPGRRILIGVFTTVKGRGKALVRIATEECQVNYLDCFDGYLPEFYATLGFEECWRDANWTPGQPDVVYMFRDAA